MSGFLPKIAKTDIELVKSLDEYYDMLVQPLHEEMYKRQSFDFMTELSAGQQFLLTYDYVRQQVLQGGFIQLIQNNYVVLLGNLPDWLKGIGADDMSQTIDDALRVYVLNREILEKETSVEEFALLYKEIKDFEALDAQFEKQDASTKQKLLAYATKYINEFAELY